MKKSIVAALLCASLFATHAHAGLISKKPVLAPMSADDAQALRGKTVAVTMHDAPEFSSTGFFSNPSLDVQGAALPEPVVIVRELMGNGLRDAFGAQVQPVDATSTKEDKAPQLAALHPEADYVLDISTQSWSITPFDSWLKGLYLQFNARARLIDTASKRVVLDYACTTTTKNHKYRPTYRAYNYNNMQLTQKVFASLAWSCSQTLARDAFRFPEGTLPATPEALVDPITVFMTPRPANPTP